MQPKIKISYMNGDGGLIGCCIVETEEEARDAMIEIVSGVSSLRGGDRFIVTEE